MTEFRSYFEQAQRCFELARSNKRRWVAEALHMEGRRFWRMALARRPTRTFDAGEAPLELPAWNPPVRLPPAG
jgi:hypothetical protein